MLHALNEGSSVYALHLKDEKSIREKAETVPSGPALMKVLIHRILRYDQTYSGLALHKSEGRNALAL